VRAFDAADYSDTDSEEELDGAEGKAEASSSGAAAKIARPPTRDETRVVGWKGVRERRQRVSALEARKKEGERGTHA
jgi:hypothetical protein